MLRVVHTADWHLGHSLHGHFRDYEHRQFLRWLVELLEQHSVDVLLVSGDVFDAANPPAAAEGLWYEFVSTAHGRGTLQTIVVGGNHDSASRLEAAQPLLDRWGVQVVGAVSTRGGELDLGKLVKTVSGAEGDRLLVGAVPFVRGADLSAVSGLEHRDWIESMRWLYAKVADRAREVSSTDPLIMMGHGYWVGGKVSDLSERKVFGGTLQALPADVFPETAQYAALGHLHLEQWVGGKQNVRYAGSPIPLAMPEASYRHSVTMLEVEGGNVVDQRVIPIPRVVEFIRVPQEEPGSLSEVMDRLRALEVEQVEEEHRMPFVEARVRLARPEPDLRANIDKAVADKAVRLVKVSVEYEGVGGTLADGMVGRGLQELSPVEVFVRKHQQQYGTDPDEALLRAFGQLLEEAQHVDRGMD